MVRGMEMVPSGPGFTTNMNRGMRRKKERGGEEGQEEEEEEDKEEIKFACLPKIYSYDLNLFSNR